MAAHEFVSSKPSLQFAREFEEREVARSLSSSNLWTKHKRNNKNQLDPTNPIWAKFKQPEEHQAETAKLESELANLEVLCNSHFNIHAKLKATQQKLRLNADQTKVFKDKFF